jgi:hypothetical protein
MQHAGGMLLPPVQTLVATFIFAQRAKMHIESLILCQKTPNHIPVVGRFLLSFFHSCDKIMSSNIGGDPHAREPFMEPGERAAY